MKRMITIVVVLLSVVSVAQARAVGVGTLEAHGSRKIEHHHHHHHWTCYKVDKPIVIIIVSRVIDSTPVALPPADVPDQHGSRNPGTTLFPPVNPSGQYPDQHHP